MAERFFDLFHTQEEQPLPFRDNCYQLLAGMDRRVIGEMHAEAEDNLFLIERQGREELIEACSVYMNEADLDMVKDAIALAIFAHAAQHRDSGDPYSTHLFAVATPLARGDMQLDAITIVSAVLHDIVEDQKVPIEYIDALFGPVVSGTVRDLTKFKGEKVQRELAQEEANIKIITSLLENPRVAIIKLYDKLHNVQTLRSKKKRASRLRTMTETREIYIPLAKIMGMHKTAQILEEELLQLENGKKQEWYETVEQRRLTELSNARTDTVSESIRSRVDFPFTEYSSVSSFAAMVHNNGQPHHKVDLVLSRELSSSGETWGLKALSLYNAIAISPKYRVAEPVDVEQFSKEMSEGITDSLVFWAVSERDGRRLHVHVYPEEAYLLDSIPLASLYYSGNAQREIVRDLGRRKHEFLKKRLLDRLEGNKPISTQLIRDLEPRLPAV